MTRTFVTNLHSGIDALEVPTGRRLWSTDVVSDPVLATKEVLITLSGGDRDHELRVAVLDAGNGRRLILSGPVPVPWPWPPKPGRDASPAFGVALAGDELTIWWSVKGRYTGGANAPAEVIERAERAARGAVRININTGRLDTRSGALVAADPSATVPPAVVRALKEVMPPPFWSGRVGDAGFACLTLREGNDKEDLELITWDLKKPAVSRSVVLFRGQGITPLVTQDGQYVLVRGEGNGAEKAGRDGAWDVFSLATGVRVSQGLEIPRDAQEHTVRGTELFMVEAGTGLAAAKGDRTLSAINLETGKPLWSYKLGVPAHQPSRRPRP